MWFTDGLGKSRQNRAFGTRVTVTVRGEVHQRVAHIGEFGDSFVELGDMAERDRLHFGTGSRPVLP